MAYNTGAMYVRTKTFTNKDGSTRTYLYLVETVRSSGKVRQEIVANLGRIERLQEKGLDSIIEGLARYSKKHWICSQGAGPEPPEKFQVLAETVEQEAKDANTELL
ncbi:MAG: hypothetical protein QM449_03755 [Synergistota bacterium]|nr:hypothetical protein [Synergistota bacterium]